MNQTYKNGEKSNFRLNFGTNLGPKNFFHEFHLYWILDTVASYHCMPFQGKLLNQIR